MARKKQTKNCLLIAGALHLDELVSLTNPAIMRASNPVSRCYSIGGVGANCALSAARATPTAQSIVLSAALGEDALAQALSGSLERHGIDVREEPVRNAGTGRYTAVMDHQGELLLGLADVALAEQLTGEHVISQIISLQPDAVLMDANLSAQCLQSISEHCQYAHVKLAAMAVSPLKARKLLTALPAIDLLFCNRREALALTRASWDDDETESEHLSLDALANDLQNTGIAQFVLTDAQHDILVQDDRERSTVAVPEVTIAHHVNGAGDALAGAAFAAYANNRTLEQAIRQYGLPQASMFISGELKAIPLSLHGKR